MGLIRKQAGFDLQAKIQTWLSTCERFRRSLEWGYVHITPDNMIKVNNFYRSFAIEQIICIGELPDYIMFDFTECQPVQNPQVPMDIPEITSQLNKASNNIIGIDRCIIHTTVWESYEFRKDKSGKWKVVRPHTSK